MEEQTRKSKKRTAVPVLIRPIVGSAAEEEHVKQHETSLPPSAKAAAVRGTPSRMLMCSCQC